MKGRGPVYPYLQPCPHAHAPTSKSGAETAVGGVHPNSTLIHSTCALLILLYVAATAAPVLLLLLKFCIVRAVAVTAAVLPMRLVEQQANIYEKKIEEQKFLYVYLNNKILKKNGVFQMTCSSLEDGTQSLPNRDRYATFVAPSATTELGRYSDMLRIVPMVG